MASGTEKWPPNKEWPLSRPTVARILTDECPLVEHLLRAQRPPNRLIYRGMRLKKVVLQSRIGCVQSVDPTLTLLRHSPGIVEGPEENRIGTSTVPSLCCRGVLTDIDPSRFCWYSIVPMSIPLRRRQSKALCNCKDSIELIVVIVEYDNPLIA